MKRPLPKVALVLCVAPYCLTAQTSNSADRLDLRTPETVSATAHKPAFVPITQSDRLRQYLKDVASPMSFVNSAAVAGIGQWENSPKEWKQGAEGFGLRYASAFGEHIVRESLLFGASSALHEDNRYIRSGQSGFEPRLWYAVTSAFLARRDDGTRRISISRIGAFAGASLISRTWQPPSTGGIQDAAGNFATSMGVAVGFNVVREFLPDVWHRR